MSGSVATFPVSRAVRSRPSPVADVVRGLREVPGPAAVGGKAWNLARLAGQNAPVPPAVVLTDEAFAAFLRASCLQPRIDEVCATLDPTRPDDLRTAALGIRALVESAPMPAPIARALERRTAALRAGGPVIVRSSAVGEDGQHASFAGQLNSVLHVRTFDELLAAVRTCWASYWSDRALFYRLARRASLSGMGVVIQRQIDAAVSGVLFTHAPDGVLFNRESDGLPTADHAGGHLLLEYCAGLGEALVSGWVDPGRLAIAREDGRVTVLQALPDAEARPGVDARLTPATIGRLTALALDLERAFGHPLDLEWTIDRDGTPWVVQARPITAGLPASVAPSTPAETGPATTTATSGPAATPPPASAPDADPVAGAHRVLWSNANVSENFPTPISPLLYSIASAGYARYFGNLGRAFGVSRRRLARMAQPLSGIIGVHGARMYYHLTNIHAVLRMAPFGDALAAAFNRFVGADRIAAPPRHAATWRDTGSRIRQAGEVARIGAAVAWQYLWIHRRVRAFERQADDYAARTSAGALTGRSAAELARDLSAFMTIRLDRWTNASLADAAAMVSYAMLDRQLARAGADPAAVTRLLRALPGVPSSQPPVRLWQLSRLIRRDPALRALFEVPPVPAWPASGSANDAGRILQAIRSDARFAAFRAALERFLEEWGFRSSAELMLTVPTLQERPEPVIDLLREYAKSGGEPPESVMARQARARRGETSRLLGRLLRRAPHRAAAVWLWLRWAQRAVAWRERVRLKQALLYTRLRGVVLAMGARLAAAGTVAAADDVFWLTWQELEEIGTGRAMFPHDVRGLVDLRRGAHARLSAMTPPDTFELPEGAYLATSPRTSAGEATVSTGAAASGAMPPTDAAFPVLAGTTACGGHVTARAAVLEDVADARRLTRGDVLVTRQTDPGWGPLFCLVSGLVIERGGLLSHGAIIAREFGLPCLVGVPNATGRIPHGATVTVDADRGRCAIHRTTPPHAAAAPPPAPESAS